MRVINILDNGTNINYGVWISAISTVNILKSKFGVDSQVWYPKTDHSLQADGIQTLGVEETSLKNIKNYIKYLKLSPGDTVIQTHGSWRYPSRWGYYFHQLGYNWVYNPHGMLNKHGFAQKSWKKLAYWYAVEQFLLKKADQIRLVSKPERDDLLKLIGNRKNNMMVIPNGIQPEPIESIPTSNDKRYVLFMSRLFHGKGVVPMVRGWLASELNNNSDYELIIAGPDQGELEKINALLGETISSNVSYVGPIYGEVKKTWLQKASFYVLPSFSEAFSTSILEAMAGGLVPIITPYCNFPEVFEKQLGIRITTEVASIKSGFNSILQLSDQEILDKQRRAIAFVNENYTLDRIAEQQHDLFQRMLTQKS